MVQAGGMSEARLSLSMVTLGTPEPRRLLRFYQRLLGWQVETDDAEWAVLRNPAGGVRLGFQAEEHFVRPIWPARPGEPQMTMHLEIEVDDLQAAARHAVECGASAAAVQPQDDVLVHLDPDGHPFCLYVE